MGFLHNELDVLGQRRRSCGRMKSVHVVFGTARGGYYAAQLDAKVYELMCSNHSCRLT